MAEVYKRFGQDWASTHSFTDEMLVELYNGESYGTPISPCNGFALGKSWLNVNVAMWLEDIEKGTLYKFELYNDTFPHWWLDSVLKGVQQKSFIL